MAMRETKFVGADGHDFCFREACDFVEVAFYNVHIAGGWADSSEELEGLLTAQVSGAQNVLDLSGG